MVEKNLNVNFNSEDARVMYRLLAAFVLVSLLALAVAQLPVHEHLKDLSVWTVNVLSSFP